jgi:signal transduction histidine kinase
MSDMLLVQAVGSLVACKDLGDVAIGVARFAQRLLDAPDVLVLLRGSEGDFVGKSSDASGELERWAAELLAVPPVEADAAGGPDSGVRHGEGRLAAFVPFAEDNLRGVLAVTLPASVTAEAASTSVSALAALVASCGTQLTRATQAARMLQDTRALMARGLHDLCTPLNSLRLGMHLLEPALTTKDPAVAQRAHRAVDRMAALVTTLAEQLGPRN